MEGEDRELDLDEIAEILEPTKRGHSYDVPGTTKKVKYDPSIRTVYNWFKLPHTMQGKCEVPTHDENRQARDAPKMYYKDDNGLMMCRWCFVEARDLGV
jgi:hypothetical protein